MPAAADGSPFPSSVLKDAVTSMPYALSAAKKLWLQSRAARLIRGVAVKSVSQLPSTPPASAPLVCA
jgi:hypothetical protein